MTKITVTKLHCKRKQDISGKDEPVIFIAGKEVWEGKMAKGDTRFPSESRRFDKSVLVELKERDNKKYKLMKAWTVEDDPDIYGETKTRTASSSGFHYELSYVLDAA